MADINPTVKICTDNYLGFFTTCGSEQKVKDLPEARAKLREAQKKDARDWAEYCHIINGEQTCQKLK